MTCLFCGQFIADCECYEWDLLEEKLYNYITSHIHTTYDVTFIHSVESSQLYNIISNKIENLDFVLKTILYELINQQNLYQFSHHPDFRW